MSAPEQNKELVLTASDTLFGKRDHAAAEEFWSEDCLQHSRHIPPGWEGLFNLVRALPAARRYDSQLAVAGHATSRCPATTSRTTGRGEPR
ncbi:hypothetical protein [Streptomyces sp. NPDC058683]|uniref:hypothetical protein n=1 Tax=Streptomyces sp. NPDC058683 TaxID=3346597 RepID=UPI00364610EA